MPVDPFPTPSDINKSENAESPKPLKVEETDRVKMENLMLKVITATNQETIAQQKIQMAQIEVGEAARLRKEYAQKLEDFKKELEKKYNVDLTKNQIREEDGLVVPRELSPKLLEALKGKL